VSPSLHDPTLHARLEEAIEHAETRSAVECVVVLAPRAGDYRYHATACGALVAFLWLLTLVYVPMPVPESLALAGVACVGVAVAAAVVRWDPALRLAVPRGERRAAAERLAKALFVEEAMTGTRDRSGILFLYAAFEQELVVVPDVGVRAAAPPEVLPELERAFHKGGAPFDVRLESTVRLSGELFSEALPRRDDDEDELPNEVRVLEARPGRAPDLRSSGSA